MAKVLITPTAQKQYEELPRLIQARMLKLFERLKEWPNVSGAKPLRGSMTGRYRMRTGDYRLQFRIEGRQVVIVIIEKIGHRNGFYDKNE